MGFGLWNTLLRPDREEAQNPERSEVGRAANLLQVGEFQLLQLAYREWHGKDLPPEIVDRLFHDYMLRGEVPHWARHYARQINRLGEGGALDENDPRYHRYDQAYGEPVPQGLARFIFAVGCIGLCLGGGIWMADRVATNAVTMLPPYFDANELPPPTDGFGRADAIEPRPAR